MCEMIRYKFIRRGMQELKIQNYDADPLTARAK